MDDTRTYQFQKQGKRFKVCTHKECGSPAAWESEGLSTCPACLMEPATKCLMCGLDSRCEDHMDDRWKAPTMGGVTAARAAHNLTKAMILDDPEENLPSLTEAKKWFDKPFNVNIGEGEIARLPDVTIERGINGTQGRKNNSDNST